MDKYIELNFAKLDIDRLVRRGYPEAIFCEHKTKEQLLKIFQEFYNDNSNILATRASLEQFEFLKKEFSNLIEYNETSKTITLIQNKIEKIGEVAICTGGTGDIPIAEEAKITAEFFGSNTKKYYDIGIAGIHRLLSKIDEIKKANVIIVIAGMEGALGSVIARLVDKPIIAVPTSVGYGQILKGFPPYLACLILVLKELML